MSTLIGVDAAKLAGLQIDQLQKFRSGQLTMEQMLWWLNRSKGERDRFAKLSPQTIDLLFEQINGGITPQSSDGAKPIVDNWPEFCKRTLGLGLDVSMGDEKIPMPKNGYIDIFMPQPLSYHMVGGIIRRYFGRASGFDSLADEIDLQKEIRDPVHGSYFVRFKYVVEASQDTPNSTTELLKSRGLSPITCLERIWLEIALRGSPLGSYQMDYSSPTYCFGSRYRDGKIPYVLNFSDKRYNSDVREFSVRKSWEGADSLTMHDTRVVVGYKTIIV